LETICSGLCRLVLIISPPRTITMGGPIQWGRVSFQSKKSLSPVTLMNLWEWLQIILVLSIEMTNRGDDVSSRERFIRFETGAYLANIFAIVSQKYFATVVKTCLPDV
jgi:hypothetical protein